MVNSTKLFFQQVKSIIKLIVLSFKHKKDFLILETYSFNEASKIGEFTFSPKVFFILGGFSSVILVALTIVIIQLTPIGYVLLSHQKHPLENDFAQIAERLQVLSDSLATSHHQLELFKTAFLGSEGRQLAYRPLTQVSQNQLALNEATESNEQSDFFIEDYLLLYYEGSRGYDTDQSSIAFGRSASNSVNKDQNFTKTSFSVPFRVDFIAPN
jgi:hypothetical protein